MIVAFRSAKVAVFHKAQKHCFAGAKGNYGGSITRTPERPPRSARTDIRAAAFGVVDDEDASVGQFDRAGVHRRARGRSRSASTTFGRIGAVDAPYSRPRGCGCRTAGCSSTSRAGRGNRPECPDPAARSTFARRRSIRSRSSSAASRPAAGPRADGRYPAPRARSRLST